MLRVFGCDTSFFSVARGRPGEPGEPGEDKFKFFQPAPLCFLCTTESQCLILFHPLITPLPFFQTLEKAAFAKLPPPAEVEQPSEGSGGG